MSDKDNINIIIGKKALKLIKKYFKFYNKILCSNLGPFGSGSLLLDQHTTVSRDGFTNVNLLRTSNTYINGVFNLLKGISDHMDKTVGDGTTSGIPITYALYTNLVKRFLKFSLGNDINYSISTPILKDILTKLNAILKKYLDNDPRYVYDFKKLSNEDKKKVIYNTALVASNNRTEIADLVAPCYYDMVDKDMYAEIYTTSEVHRSDDFKDYYEFLNTVDLRSLHMDTQAYGIDRDGVIENPYFLVYTADTGFDFDFHNKKVLSLLEIYVHDESIGRPLVLVAGNAHTFQRHCMQFNNSPESKNKVYTLAHNIKEDWEINHTTIINDVACLTGAKEINEHITLNSIVDQYELGDKAALFDILGECEALTMTTALLSSFKGLYKLDRARCEAMRAMLYDRYEILKLKDYDEATRNGLMKACEVRRSRLTGLTYNLKIYAKSFDAYNTKKLVIDDTVLAVSSLLDPKNNSYTLGGNVAIVAIINDNFKDICSQLKITYANILSDKVIDDIVNIVKESFKASLQGILLNKFSASKVKKIMNNIYDSKELTMYNLLTEQYCKLTDFHNTNNVINPIQTEKELLYSILYTVGELIDIKNIISLIGNYDEKIKLR